MTREPLPPSLYAATARPAPATPPLDGDRRADVAVIGAGFTGLSTALHLAEHGANVVVPEAHEPGWGASGRNGGQVNPGLKWNPDDVEKEFGPELRQQAGPLLPVPALLPARPRQPYRRRAPPRAISTTRWSAMTRRPLVEIPQPPIDKRRLLKTSQLAQAQASGLRPITTHGQQELLAAEGERADPATLATPATSNPAITAAPAHTDQPCSRCRSRCR